MRALVFASILLGMTPICCLGQGKPFVGKNVYFVGFGEVGKMNGDPFPTPTLSGDGAIGVIAVTAVGPVFIRSSPGDTGYYNWVFQLSSVF
jgi:hypothetical protein